MNVSLGKRLILETMWMLEKPAKATEIAKATGLGFPSVMMHIIGLIRMEYAASPVKGYYTITAKGKSMLGFPKINREKAYEILASLPLEKSFHFYTNIGKPLNIHAISLHDFCEKILKIDQSSIEFHLNRGDFEAWFAGLGDIELARKVMLLREKRIFGEELRKRLYEIAKNRCEELNKILGLNSYSA